MSRAVRGRDPAALEHVDGYAAVPDEEANGVVVVALGGGVERREAAARATTRGRDHSEGLEEPQCRGVAR